MTDVTRELIDETRELQADVAEAAEAIYECSKRLGRDIRVTASLALKSLTIEYDKRGV